MKIKSLCLLLSVLVTTSGLISARSSVAAADAMENMNCSQAESMLESAVKTKVPSMMTGDVDKDFATIIIVHEKVTARINQIEAKCGKDPKMQSAAAKQAADAQLRMNEFRNLGTSQ